MYRPERKETYLGFGTIPAIAGYKVLAVLSRFAITPPCTRVKKEMSATAWSVEGSMTASVSVRKRTLRLFVGLEMQAAMEIETVDES